MPTKNYPHLNGKPITLREAAEKYNVPKSTLFSWVRKYKYVRILRTGYKIEVDEADIAYCADLYHTRQKSGLGKSGAPLLDPDGQPYRLKRRDVAIYRKTRRETSPA